MTGAPATAPISPLLLWTTLAVPVVALAGWLEWFLRRRAARPLTTTEWRERMAELDLARPPASRIEGKPGVCSVAREGAEEGEGSNPLARSAPRRRNVLAITSTKATGTKGKGGRG